jgi:hypothetical protein
VRQHDFDHFKMRSVNQTQFSEFEANFSKVENLATNDSHILVEIVQAQRDLEFEIARIKDGMAKKMDMVMYNRLEEKFNHYTPITKFLALEHDINNYASRETVDELMAELRYLSADVELKAYTEDLEPQFHDLCVKSKALSNECKDLGDRLASIQSGLYELKSFCKQQITDFETKTNQSIEVFSTRVNTLPTITSLNDKLKEVWNNFSNCCEYSHIKDLKGEMGHRMNECENAVADYKLDLTTKNEIIRRFDEVLLEKANKFQIEQIYNTLDGYTTADQFQKH